MNSNRDFVVGRWLMLCAGLVFAMVVLGGVTRLTGSGLSMVDWRPVLGWLPPLTDDQWQATFELYQQSPQYQKVNAHMDVHDFKGIFWLEYLHRLLGRTVGLVFAVPFLWFLARGTIQRSEAVRFAGLFVLGGLQGVLGWYMVKSGLIDDPHVSPYRLTAHLLMAVFILGLLLWMALDRLEGRPQAARRRGRGLAIALTALVAVTVTSGGFVAGTKAGHAYNTFPTMAGYWLPPGMTTLDPLWRNLFENLAMVQFNHRWLAFGTLLAIVAFWVHALRGGLPADLRWRGHAVLGLTVVQVSLGISTLLLAVPVALGSAHQAVGILLLATLLSICHGLSRTPRGDPAPVHSPVPEALAKG